MPVPNPQFRFFDPSAEVDVIERQLPHWVQTDTVAFITWRTWDSIPKPVLAGWLEERSQWLLARGIDPENQDWKSKFRNLAPDQRREYFDRFSTRWHNILDECHGECLLRQPSVAKIVSESLLKFDGERYQVSDFVVMPNHVHILVSFLPDFDMLQQCTNWKHFTARAINQQCGRTGRFWQVDGYDHLVRSSAQFLNLRAYIAENPAKAKLRSGEFVHYSKPEPTAP